MVQRTAKRSGKGHIGEVSLTPALLYALVDIILDPTTPSLCLPVLTSLFQQACMICSLHT